MTNQASVSTRSGCCNPPHRRVATVALACPIGSEGAIMRVRLPFVGHLPQALATATLIALVTSVPVRADPILLDQASVPTQGPNDPLSTFAMISDPANGFFRAQTFTVGRSGRLARVDVLLVGEDSDVLLQILDTAAGVPTMTVLGSRRSTLTTEDGWRTFDLADRLAVAAGRVLAIELVNVNNGSFAWRGQEPGPRYAGGADFFRNDFAGFPTITLNPNHDNYFRTFVETAATPEPSTLLLMVPALATLVRGRTKPV